MSTTPQQPQQPSQSPAPAPSSVPGVSEPQSMTVRHQHMADPASNTMKGNAPTSPYLIQHPAFPNGVPGTWSPQAAAPAKEVEPPPPPVLHDMGLKVLDRLGQSAISRVGKMKKAVWNSNYSPDLSSTKLTGVQAVSPYDATLSRATSKLIDPVKHPDLSKGLNWAVGMGLGSMLKNKVDPYAHYGSPNNDFNQRLQTNRMFLNSGNGAGDNPLIKLLGGVARAAVGGSNVDELKTLVSDSGAAAVKDAWSQATGK